MHEIRGFTNWKDASGDKRGGFAIHERFQVHKYCVELTMTTHKDVGELLSIQHKGNQSCLPTYCYKIL